MAMVLIFLAAAGLFAYFAHRGHLVGEIASVVLLPCAIHGVWRGGFRKTAMLAVTMGLFYLLSVKPDFAAPLVSAIGGPTSTAAQWVAAGGIALVAWMTTFFLARKIQRRVIAPRRFLGATDRFAGTFVGAAEGALVVLSLCWCASSLRPYATNLVHANDTVAGSPKDRIGKYMLQIAEEADIGLLGRITQATNPINQVPALRDAIEQLNTTGRFDIESLDPSTVNQIQGLLQQSGVSNDVGLDSLHQQVKENDSARDAAHRR